MSVLNDHRDPHHRPQHGPDTLRFGCDDCCRQGSSHCADCLVTHLCTEGDGSVVVSLDDLRLVRRFQVAGLAPPLRHRRRIVG